MEYTATLFLFLSCSLYYMRRWWISIHENGVKIKSEFNSLLKHILHELTNIITQLEWIAAICRTFYGLKNAFELFI